MIKKQVTCPGVPKNRLPAVTCHGFEGSIVLLKPNLARIHEFQDLKLGYQDLCRQLFDGDSCQDCDPYTEFFQHHGYPLVMTNIAMGNDPFVDGLPIKNGDFPWLC